jgi:hypothetical protein
LGPEIEAMGLAWEKLVEFPQKAYPQSLPRVRAEVLNDEEE